MGRSEGPKAILGKYEGFEKNSVFFSTVQEQKVRPVQLFWEILPKETLRN